MKKNTKKYIAPLNVAKFSFFTIIAAVLILWLIGQIATRIWPADFFSFRILGVFANKAGELHDTGIVFSDVLALLISVPVAAALISYFINNRK